MNKRLLPVLFIILLLILASCAKEAPDKLSNTEQSSDVSFDPQSCMTGTCSKDHVAEFMRVLGGQALDGLSLGYIFR